MNMKRIKNVAMAIVAGICLFTGETFAYIKKDSLRNWDDPGNDGKILVNGNYYGENVVWTVVLQAGTAGSLFGDTWGPVETFRYETVVTVNGVEKLVIPGGTWSSNMGYSSYTVQIPLKQLGILDKEACGLYYLTAFTRNYSYGSTVDTGYSLITEDISVRISYSEECDPSKYSLGIKADHDKTHPDGVMLHVTGTLPKGTPAKIKRDGVELKTITGQGYLFDYIPPSDSCRTYNYEITVEPECSEKIVRNCSGSPGMARVGKMSITNENYQALVVKYNQPENLTVEFTDAEELKDYHPFLISRVDGSADVPRHNSLEEQILTVLMLSTKVLYTIDNMKFKEGTHGDYTFKDLESYYYDREVGLKHIVPNGPEYKEAESRVLFMRDEYLGFPTGTRVSAKVASQKKMQANWFRYWQKEVDGTIELLSEANNIHFGCDSLDSAALAHHSWHKEEFKWYNLLPKKWFSYVCLSPALSAKRAPEFTLR